MESVVGVSTVSVPAVEEVAVVPVLAVALMADGQQVQEGLLLQLVAPKLQMLRLLVLGLMRLIGVKVEIHPHGSHNCLETRSRGVITMTKQWWGFMCPESLHSLHLSSLPILHFHFPHAKNIPFCLN